jgi:hypothetical protein
VECLVVILNKLKVLTLDKSLYLPLFTISSTQPALVNHLNLLFIIINYAVTVGLYQVVATDGAVTLRTPPFLAT